jgi:adenosylmethionine-8-amino-7-oxononanoate aminotransferase
MMRMEPERARELVRLDKAHVWHPFTQMKGWLASEPLVIERAEGFELIDSQGKRYLDGVSSLWVNVHGHRVPEIDDAINRQLGLVAHSTLLGLGNVPSIELAARLVELAPPGLEKVFYSEAGACAVEIALKMAFGYWRHRGSSTKRTFLSLENAYHGDTLGAVSVGGIDTFHAAYHPLLFDTYKAPSPYCYRCPLGRTYPSCDIACLAPLEAALAGYAQDICAVVVEPLVQAAAGMITAPPGYLRRVRELCDRYDVLLIVDEVATGVGRTGTFFACEQEDVTPDILVIGKGITGGYLPLAVTMTTNEVFDAFLGEHEEMKTFFHGHTYTGNPLSCAAAIANIDLMEAHDTLAGVADREAVMSKALEPLCTHPHVGDIRQRGLMAGIELVSDKATKQPYDTAERVGARVCEGARAQGVIIRPLSDVIVLMPPLALPPRDIERLVAVTAASIGEVTS